MARSLRDSSETASKLLLSLMAEDMRERDQRQYPVETRDTPPHPILGLFEPWEGWVEPGCDVNFLGVRTRVAFFSLFERLADYSRRRWFKAKLPVPNEDYFEWIAVLEAVAETRGSFTMVELGAGWGKWIVNAVAALRQYSALPYDIVAVEAEPTHFEWMKQHLNDNDIDSSRATLIEAAVAPTDGEVWFHVGARADWYGQAIASDRQAAPGSGARRVERVRAVSVRTILGGLEQVDLLDVDIRVSRPTRSSQQPMC
jgi:FkbM family methyltransferase